MARPAEAVEEEFPANPSRRRKEPRGRGRPARLTSDAKRVFKAKPKWARHRMRKAESMLRQLQRRKDASRHNRLTPAFLAKVALSWPSTSARAFANAWRDLVGVGAVGCSRPAISKVKDAFAEAPAGDGMSTPRCNPGVSLED